MRPVSIWKSYSSIQRLSHLPRRHGLGDQPLKGKLLLLEVIRRRPLDLELLHGLGERLLDLLLLAALELDREGGVGDDVLNTRDVPLELLLGLEPLAESIIGALELLGICILR